jgi:two-component system cell cycle sensor histidine kinase/response regulator CckA
MEREPVKSYKILIVEDDRTSSIVLSAMLKKSSLPVSDLRSAECLAEACSLLDNDHFDVVLLDLNLPDSQNLDTVVQVTSKYPDVAIVVITAEFDENTGLKAIAIGAQEYLTKGYYDVRGLTKSVYYAIERKQAEREKQQIEALLRRAQKMEAIGTLAGGIAHDFNNMLGAMTGFTNLALQDIPEGTRAHDNLKEVLVSANRAKDLIGQILTFGREGEEDRRPLRIASVAREALRTIRSALPSNVTVRENIEATDSLIMGNLIHVHQIMLNLCSNASDAMAEKKGSLEVAVTDVDVDRDATVNNVFLKQGHYVRLTVSDTGCGMAPEVMEHIFEPFFTTKEVGKGTGMGLSVVHGITKKCGALIGVESREGEGTTFSVFFPKIQAEDAQVAEPSAAPKEDNGLILLVDDESVIVHVMKQTLERFGYRVIGKTSSPEALEAFEAEPDKFNLVITDHRMPQMTGLQLTKSLLAIRPDIPIVLCTGYSKDISPEQAKSLGIKAYIMKPVTGDILRETIKGLSAFCRIES